MTALTQWQGGSLNANSVAYQAAFLTADLASLPNGSSVMSSTAFNNATALDQFLDVSLVGVLTAAETIAAGSGIGLYIAYLQGDGVTYGDGRLTAGAQAAYQPLVQSLGGIPIQTGTTITDLWGDIGGITIKAKSFRMIVMNNSGFAFAASGSMVYIATYRQNVNS